MKLEQIKGPFSANDTKTFAETDAQYVHVGVQMPKASPIGTVVRNGSNEAAMTEGVKSADIEINGHGFAVNETGILEFDGELSDGQVKVTFKKALPAETIIDILYSSINEDE